MMTSPHFILLIIAILFLVIHAIGRLPLWPSVLVILVVLLLSGCASDGSLRVGTTIPLGDQNKAGSLWVGVEYHSPYSFEQVVQNPRLLGTFK